ncbi:MAG: HDOD domain-containing protein, partial [Pseudomonadota bacterium]
MDIKQRITDIVRDKNTQIPTLPVVVDNVLNAAKDDRTSAKDLARFISNDQAIANKILRLANSAYYGMIKEIDSISRAITVIGFNEVVSITIGMSTINAFQEKDFHGVLDIKDLWMHSICCAMMTRQIAKNTGKGQPEQYFLTGLLHDMGKVVFAIYLPEEYAEVLKEAKESGTPLFRKEKEMMGIDHAGLTGILMERWSFPDSLVYPS